MKTVQPFVDLGLYVVPIDGLIRRDENGIKIKPKFRGNWKELYLDTPYDPEGENEAPALTGAMICGKRSGAVSIDCDNQATLDILKALDPEYKFIFESLGKEAGGGSIIYRLTDEYTDLPMFRIHNGEIELDFQTDDFLQFLPTSGNKSKVEWLGDGFETMPELKEPPQTVINMLKMLYSLEKRSKALLTQGAVTLGAQKQHYKHLAPYLTTFVKSGKFAPELFRILTPNDGGFKQLPQYVEERTLHPDSVPEGMGNQYLMSIAGILVCDNSVNAKLFKSVLTAINNLWSRPYPNDKLSSLIRHELGREKWVYDDKWQEKVSVILTDYNTLVNVFYDPLIRRYYALDSKLGMSTFTSVDALPKHLNSIVQGGRIFKALEIYNYLEQKQTMLSPLEPYGDLDPESDSSTLARYNFFSRNEAYDILLHPKKYKEKYEGKVPKATLAFFDHLIPDDETREYVLRFILTKLLTMNFSEVILYFLGMSGAGKNLFIDWLAKFTENTVSSAQSAEYTMVLEVDLENFLSKYNLWITNALFANLDEYGEKSGSTTEDRRILAQLKSYTGKSNIQLRSMHTDPLPASHKCTFILTANENKLSPDLHDRRIVLIDTPEALDSAEYTDEYGGTSGAIEAMFNEMSLWSYYWVTKYKKLEPDEYRTPPDTEFKRRLIMRHLPPSKRIAAAVFTKNVGQLLLMCEETGLIQRLHDDAKYGAVSKKFLVELFESMTEGMPSRKAMLDVALRELKVEASRMRFGGRVEYGIPIPEFKEWASRLSVADGLLLHADEE